MNFRTRLYGMRDSSMHPAIYHVAIYRDRNTPRGLVCHLIKHEMFPGRSIDVCIADIENDCCQLALAHLDNNRAIGNRGAVTTNVFGRA